jgi:hypothetical protein
MQSLIQDLRYGLASFARTPGFTAAAVLSLAIGVGRQHSILQRRECALFLHPLPYPSGGSAGDSCGTARRGPGITEGLVSRPLSFSTSRRTRASFEAGRRSPLAATKRARAKAPSPSAIGVINISAGLLPMLGARPAVGRLLLPAENDPGRASRRRAGPRHMERAASAAIRGSSGAGSK